MLVLAGDVFLLFDHRDVSAPPEGVTALSMRVESRAGVRPRRVRHDRHGRVTRTLQKVSVQAMDAAGATDFGRPVLIDTGLLFFDAPSAQAMATLAGVPAEPRRKSRPGLQDRFAGQVDLFET